MPRILFVCQEVPFPPINGIRWKPFNIIQALSASYECEVLAFERPGQSVNGGAGRCVIGAGTVSLLAICGAESGVTLRLSQMAHLLRGRPVSLARWKTREFHTRLTDALRARDIQVIHLDMMNMCQYAAVCRGVPTVLSINDSFSRFYRELLRARGLGCVESAYLWTQVRAHLRVEKELLPTMDCVHVVSTEEADYLAAEAGLSNVTVIPIAVDDAYFGIGVACGGRRLLSVGNLRRSGLYRALWCFLEREWRSLRRCFPGVTLTVLGGCWIDERMREQLSLYEGVSVHGWVESDLPFLESCDACLAFDQVRGGMKNRVAQALAAGRALVGTPEAVEGLEGRDGQHFLAAASSGAMRTAVCDLLSSRTLAMDIGAAARRLAGARYAQAVVGAQWARLYGARVACAASATTNGERIRA